MPAREATVADFGRYGVKGSATRSMSATGRRCWPGSPNQLLRSRYRHRRRQRQRVGDRQRRRRLKHGFEVDMMGTVRW